MSIFGFSTETSNGGDFLPIVKYDARAGRIFRVDRVDVGGQFSSEPVDITRNFKAIVDLENIETGWINFAAGGAPDFKLVPMGSILPARPTDQHKNGIRLMLKLAKECGGDKPIREIAGTSKAFLSGVEKLYHEYANSESRRSMGELPIVALQKDPPNGFGSTSPVTSGQGSKMSTNYVPNFEIIGWAPRGDLVFEPKGGAKIRPATNGAATPPATGSNRVDPPAMRQAFEKAQAAGEEDFG